MIVSRRAIFDTRIRAQRGRWLRYACVALVLFALLVSVADTEERRPYVRFGPLPAIQPSGACDGGERFDLAWEQRLEWALRNPIMSDAIFTDPYADNGFAFGSTAALRYLGPEQPLGVCVQKRIGATTACIGPINQSNDSGPPCIAIVFGRFDVKFAGSYGAARPECEVRHSEIYDGTHHYSVTAPELVVIDADKSGWEVFIDIVNKAHEHMQRTGEDVFPKQVSIMLKAANLPWAIEAREVAAYSNRLFALGGYVLNAPAITRYVPPALPNAALTFASHPCIWCGDAVFVRLRC